MLSLDESIEEKSYTDEDLASLRHYFFIFVVKACRKMS